MCGWVVIVRRHGHVDREHLASGLARLSHRGPDAAQTLVEPWTERRGTAPEIGFGHARLAIIDLDPRSNQPMAIGADRLVYNGEIYNFKTLGAGFDLRTRGDSEVLLRLLQRDGLAALNRANGMWSFCWLDGGNRLLHAARDRYGKKPLFYLVTSDEICLASEPAALLALVGEKPVLRQQAADSFLADGWLFPDPSGQTHLDGVKEVRPGHCLTLDLARWTLDERLVSPVLGPVPGPDHAQADIKTDAPLTEVLADAVESRLVSDRKVGLFLSGGIDSSLILSVLAAKGLTDQVICVTGEAGKSADGAYAKACIAQLGIDSLTVPLDYGMASFEQFLQVCAAQAKPFPLIGNVLGMHALYAAVAPHDIRVVLDGTGADEIFGGYWYRYFGFARRDALRKNDIAWLARMPGQGAVGPCLPQREGLTAADGMWLLDGVHARLKALPANDPLIGFDGTLNEALIMDATKGRMQEWLWQNDRSAMAASIENRSPFLDHRIAPHLRAGYDTKFEAGFNKCALRREFANFVPLPTATRTDKQGFRWDYTSFMRNNREAIVDLIASSRLVAAYADIDRLAGALRSGDDIFEFRVFHRLLVLAGLEASGAVSL